LAPLFLRVRHDVRELALDAAGITKLLPHQQMAGAIVDFGGDFGGVVGADRAITGFSVAHREVTQEVSDGGAVRAVRAKVAANEPATAVICFWT